MKRYLVFPGYVISKNDGDWHFITADQLMYLYQVKREECIVYPFLDRMEGRMP